MSDDKKKTTNQESSNKNIEIKFSIPVPQKLGDLGKVASDGISGLTHIGEAAASGINGAADAASAVAKGINANVKNIKQGTQKASEVAAQKNGKLISEEQMQELLSTLYKKGCEGIPALHSPDIESLAQDYLKIDSNPAGAANKFVAAQIAKCGAAGFLANLGGLLTLPAGVSVDVGSVLYMQLRMIAGIAYMGGYDLDSDQVQTMVYLCLVGSAINDVLKDVGVKIGNKMATAALKKLPGAVLARINRAVGFRLVTKFGQKGIINLVDLVPVVGGVVGAGFDVASTKIIANNALSLFIKGEVPNEHVQPEPVEVPSESEVIKEDK